MNVWPIGTCGGLGRVIQGGGEGAATGMKSREKLKTSKSVFDIAQQAKNFVGLPAIPVNSGNNK